MPRLPQYKTTFTQDYPPSKSSINRKITTNNITFVHDYKVTSHFSDINQAKTLILYFNIYGIQGHLQKFPHEVDNKTHVDLCYWLLSHSK